MEVKMVQIGLTTRCNSNCYFCLREELKREGRKEGFIDLPIEAIEIILDQGIKDIHLCGNRGEAIFHPQIDYIIDRIKQENSKFEMNTNGDRFDIKWWYDLGQKMTPGDKIIFALDGLKNAHENYRKTNWNRVFNNIKAFIQGGGNAVWQMILFEHNEKQINLIKHLSKSIGCSETWIINSRLYNDQYRKPTKDGKTKEDILKEKNPNKILCKFFEGERVYVDVYGKVWPCCYMKCHFGFDEVVYKNSTLFKLYKQELDFIDVMNTPLNEIVDKSKAFNFIFSHMNDDVTIDYGHIPFNHACQHHCGNTEEIDKNNRRITIN